MSQLSTQLPCSNKLLQRKWQQDDTARHYSRLNNVKPIVESFTNSKVNLSFIKNNPKLKKLKEGKLDQIF
jgi:hypothetical protein